MKGSLLADPIMYHPVLFVWLLLRRVWKYKKIINISTFLSIPVRVLALAKYGHLFGFPFSIMDHFHPSPASLESALSLRVHYFLIPRCEGNPEPTH